MVTLLLKIVILSLLQAKTCKSNIKIIGMPKTIKTIKMIKMMKMLILLKLRIGRKPGKRFGRYAGFYKV